MSTLSFAETRLEVGPTLLSMEYSDGFSAILFERFDDKWDIGIGWISEQTMHTGDYVDIPFTTEIVNRTEIVHELRENIFIIGQRVFHVEYFEFGIGIAYFNNINRGLGSKMTLPLTIAFTWKDYSIRFRHFSNGGSATPNTGQDMVTFGYTF